jgi:hypothetical protein
MRKEKNMSKSKEGRCVWQFTIDEDLKYKMMKHCEDHKVKYSSVISILIKMFLEDRLQLKKENK